MSSLPPSFPPSRPRSRPEDVDAALRERLPVAEPEPELVAAAPESEPPPRVTNRLAERLEELRAAKGRARRRRLGTIGGLLAAAALLAWVVLASPLLALDLEEVDVEGAGPLVSSGDVDAVLAPFEGTPLARVNTGAIRDRLVEHVAIKEADVSRAWPTGLRIVVVPRTPVAATPAADGYAVLDGDGIELGVEPEEPEGVPLINLPDGLEDAGATIAAVLEVMDALPEEILEQVDTVGADGPDEVTFTLDSGAQVIWGSPEESELKASVLDVLLQVPAQVYNVASPLSPITS